MNKDLITGKSVIEIEIKSLMLMKKEMSESFDKAIKLLYQTNGKIVVSGIGKTVLGHKKTDKPTNWARSGRLSGP